MTIIVNDGIFVYCLLSNLKSILTARYILPLDTWRDNLFHHKREKDHLTHQTPNALNYDELRGMQFAVNNDSVFLCTGPPVSAKSYRCCFPYKLSYNFNRCHIVSQRFDAMI